MPYGSLSERQRSVIASLVKGRSVFDFGSGDCVLTQDLVEMGASEVTAVDKENYEGRTPTGVTFIRSYFKDLPPRNFDLVFLSWPANWDTGLVPHLKRAKTILYLGKNTDGSACGYPDMFRYLMTREITSYIPERPNTLIYYGDPLGGIRQPRGEEAASLNSMTGGFWPFDKAEGF